MNPQIYKLRQRALKGDAAAIGELRDLALQAIAVLESFTNHSPGHPDTPEPIRAGVNAAHELAKHSSRWPVAYDAISERRKTDMERAGRLEVGSKLGIRIKGKARGFSYDQQTGFALDVFNHLDPIRRNPANHIHPADLHPELAAPGMLTEERLKRDWRNLAAVLPELSKASLSLWADTGLELCREWCEGNWSRFPWSDCVKGKIGSITDAENANKCGPEKAVRDKILGGLAKLHSLEPSRRPRIA